MKTISLMAKRLLAVAWILVAALGMTGESIASQFSVPDTPSALLDLNYPVEFTGQDHVDLMWSYAEPGYDSFRIYRDGAVIQTVSYSTTFFRDSGVAFGETHLYQVCAFNSASQAEYCGGLPQYAFVGQINGNLRQSVSWNAGSYYIAYEVHVHPGATLSIGSGALVSTSATPRQIDDLQGGAITVNGANIATHMILANNASSFQSSTLHDGADLSLQNNVLFSGNTITDTATLTLIEYPGSPPERVVSQSIFGGEAGLYIFNVEALIAQNTFTHSSIFLANQAGAVIESNGFYRRGAGDFPGIRIDDAAGVVINGNIWDYTPALINPYYATAIQVTQSTPNVAIDGNRIVYGFIDTKSTQTTLTNNVLVGRGVQFSLTSSGQVTGNTIVQAGTAIRVETNATPVIQNNCLADNPTGVYATYDRTVPLDITANWWGSPNGPSAYDNPGDGDSAVGAMLDYSGWLASDNCAVSDISLEGKVYEAVQVVQNLTNEVPLIAGKPTALRVYLESRIGLEASIPGDLTAYRDGLYLDKWPSHNSAPAARINTIDELRAERDKGLLFALPETFVDTGSLTLVVEANPSHQPPEISYDNNVITETLVVTRSNLLRVGFVPIHYQPTPSSPIYKPALSKIGEMCSHMRTIFPSAQIDCWQINDVKWEKEMRQAYYFETVEWRNGRELLTLLNGILMQWNSTHPPEKRLHQLIGLFPGEEYEYLSYCLGDPRAILDNLPAPGLGRVSYCWGGEAGIHALAHNFGLRHASVLGQPCYAPDDVFSSYWSALYTNNSIQEYGFDFRTGKVVARHRPDLMSAHCSDTWLSPLHYLMLYQSEWIPQPATTGELPVSDPGYLPRLPVGNDYLLVSGDVLLGPNGGAVTFHPAWQLISSAPPEVPLDGTEYCFELQDASQNLISSQCLDLYWYNSETDKNTGYAPFYTVLPLGNTQAADNAALAPARLVAKFGGAVIRERLASPNPPSVTLQSPNGGETLGNSLIVHWAGHDPDGDTLAYRLLYSSDDGLTWTQITQNLSASAALLDFSNFPATSQARIKVEASDGFHTASDSSDGTFTVPQKSPSVAILSPADGARLDTFINLIGAAYDPEDGNLSGASLVWSSDLDGVLGTGVTLQLSGLSEGLHTITLTATDSQGSASTASIQITFAQPEAISALSASNDSPKYTRQLVTFDTDLTTGTNVSFAWAFGDGAYGSGSHPTHIYDMFGSFTAVVTATNSLDSQTVTTPVTVLPTTVDPDPSRLYLPALRLNTP